MTMPRFPKGPMIIALAALWGCSGSKTSPQDAAVDTVGAGTSLETDAGSGDAGLADKSRTYPDLGAGADTSRPGIGQDAAADRAFDSAVPNQDTGLRDTFKADVPLGGGSDASRDTGDSGGFHSTCDKPDGQVFASIVQALAAGDAHTCALTTAGGVRCWGSNNLGGLGDGTTTDRHTPPSTDVLTGVQAITVAGVNHTCALMTTGGVRCWGNNNYGQLGDGTTTRRYTPPKNDILTGGRAIESGYGHVCALLQTGGVRCWGSNSNGQLGDGTTINLPAPPPTCSPTCRPSRLAVTTPARS